MTKYGGEGMTWDESPPHGFELWTLCLRGCVTLTVGPFTDAPPRDVPTTMKPNGSIFTTLRVLSDCLWASGKCCHHFTAFKLLCSTGENSFMVNCNPNCGHILSHNLILFLHWLHSLIAGIETAPRLSGGGLIELPIYVQCNMIEEVQVEW